MKITNIDWWESDALLNINGEEFYFQFEFEPSIENAIQYFKYDKTEGVMPNGETFQEQNQRALALIKEEYGTGYID